MSDRFDRITTVIMVAASLAIAATVVWRELGPDVAPSLLNTRTTEGDWKSWMPQSRLIGDSGAPLQVSVFSDLECPFCADFHARVERLMSERPGQIAMRFYHYPLDYHPFGRQAAYAAECALAQGRFEQMVSSVFRSQRSRVREDTLALEFLSALASEAEIPSLDRFRRCLVSRETASIVDSIRRLGDRIGVRGTPTVLLNQFRYSQPPSDSAILEYLARIPRAP